MLVLVLVAAACHEPTLGTANMFGDDSCYIGLVSNDVGWNLEFEDCPNAIADESAPTCSNIGQVGSAFNSPIGSATISLTKAAVKTSGTVAITTEAQVADVASVSITNGGMPLPTGTFTVMAVDGSLTATFSAGSGSAELYGTITDAPYCQ
jgi:hypothetical protein